MQDLSTGTAHLAVVDEAEPAEQATPGGLATEQNVARHIEGLHECEILIHGFDANGLRAAPGSVA